MARHHADRPRSCDGHTSAAARERGHCQFPGVQGREHRLDCVVPPRDAVPPAHGGWCDFVLAWGVVPSPYNIYGTNAHVLCAHSYMLIFRSRYVLDVGVFPESALLSGGATLCLGWGGFAALRKSRICVLSPSTLVPSLLAQVHALPQNHPCAASFHRLRHHPSGHETPRS